MYTEFEKSAQAQINAHNTQALQKAHSKRKAHSTQRTQLKQRKVNTQYKALVKNAHKLQYAFMRVCIALNTENYSNKSFCLLIAINYLKQISKQSTSKKALIKHLQFLQSKAYTSIDFKKYYNKHNLSLLFALVKYSL